MATETSNKSVSLEFVVVGTEPRIIDGSGFESPSQHPAIVRLQCGHDVFYPFSSKKKRRRCSRRLSRQNPKRLLPSAQTPQSGNEGSGSEDPPIPPTSIPLEDPEESGEEKRRKLREGLERSRVVERGGYVVFEPTSRKGADDIRAGEVSQIGTERERHDNAVALSRFIGGELKRLGLEFSQAHRHEELVLFSFIENIPSMERGLRKRATKDVNAYVKRWNQINNITCLSSALCFPLLLDQSRIAHINLMNADPKEKAESLYRIGIAIYVKRLLEKQRRFAEKYGLENQLNPGLDLNEYALAGEAAFPIGRATIMDVVDDPGKRGLPPEDFLTFFVDAHIISGEFVRLPEQSLPSRKDYEDDKSFMDAYNRALKEEMSRGLLLVNGALGANKLPLLDRFPNQSIIELNALTGQISILTSLDDERSLRRLRGKKISGSTRDKIEGILKKLIHNTVELKQEFREMAISDSGDEEGKQKLRDRLYEYFDRGGYVSDKALEVLGITEPKECRVVYRRITEEIKKAESEKDRIFYRKLASAIEDYYRFIGLYLREDLEDITNGTLKPEDCDWEGLREITDSISGKNRGNEYILTFNNEIDAIDWCGITPPKSVIVELDPSQSRRFSVTLGYEDCKTGEELAFVIEINAVLGRIDWSVLEDMEEEEKALYITIATNILKGIGDFIRKEDHKKDDNRSLISRNRVEGEEAGSAEYVPDEINDIRRQAKAEIREARDRREREAGDLYTRDQISRVRRNEIKMNILDSDSEIEGHISKLPQDVREKILEAIGRFNNGESSYRFRSLRSKVHGKRLFRIRVGDYRLLLEQDGETSIEGEWCFRIVKIGKKNENYRRLGLSQ